MENAITAGLSRQIVLTRALEATANNIANLSTAGYKAERVAFEEYLVGLDADAGDPLVSLVYDADSYADFSAGALEQTYNDLDFAIDGEGFFALETPAGPRYTRDGRFSLDADGVLVTRTGAPVLDASGASILIDVEEGPIVLSAEGELQQNGAAIAQLGVYRFEDPRVLSKDGANLYVASSEPEPVAFTRLRQGFIETSNVAPIAAITDMIEIMRAYEQAAQVVQTSDELARQAVRVLSESA